MIVLQSASTSSCCRAPGCSSTAGALLFSNLVYGVSNKKNQLYAYRSYHSAYERVNIQCCHLLSA